MKWFEFKTMGDKSEAANITHHLRSHWEHEEHVSKRLLISGLHYQIIDSEDACVRQFWSQSPLRHPTTKLYRDRLKRWSPGCVNATGKARQE